MTFTKNSVISISWFIFLLLQTQCQERQPSNDTSWPEIGSEQKPGVYMHLMGSAANQKDMTHYLSSLQKVGIGGALIIPIYGVTGKENKYINFLSPGWMDMLQYTTRIADSLDINIDVTTGTGWPFGGSHTTPKDAAIKIGFETYEIQSGEEFHHQTDTARLVTIEAFGPDKKRIGLKDRLQPSGQLNWTAPDGKWTVYILHHSGTGQMVKRAAPGNEGLVLNPFSPKSMKVYLQRFDSAFQGYEGKMPRSQYHDSYEYYRADWTDDLFDTFFEQHDYDLKDYLPELFGTGDPEIASRVKADFRVTLADLHLEYIRIWIKWAHDKGMITRNEGHGSPANWLDIYSESDIPETEIFGSTPFKIPDWQRLPENNSTSVPLNPLILRFASSAAHVSGKKLIASETLTWLREHFRSSLWQAKPEIDRLFLSGINHIFYHGSAYSPADAPWPGWLFYASVHYQPENALWHDIDQLNGYASRCQSILQSGQPDNDILLYWPIHDIYHRYPDLLIKGMNVHDIEWFTNSEFGHLADQLWQDGYTFDYISGRQVSEIISNKNNLQTKGGQYKTIIIPKTSYIPLHVWEKILKLANNGAFVIVYDSLPSDVPGLAQLEQRQKSLIELNNALHFTSSGSGSYTQATYGSGRILLGTDLKEMIATTGIKREVMSDMGLEFIRRQHGANHDYFVSNLSASPFEGWLPLAVPFLSAVLLDPLEKSKIGEAATQITDDKSEIYLQLKSGESIVIRTFATGKINVEKWAYFTPQTNEKILRGNWEVAFIQGGPELPKPFHTDTLRSWTSFGDSASIRFAGTARYSLTFNLDKKQADNWMLDLGKVCESARIRINGKDAGALWSIPFSKAVGKYLKQGTNTLEIEVTNLSANRLRDLDHRGVDWKKYFFVSVQYRNFDASKWPIADSGLLGPVRLIPMRIKNM